MIVARACRIRAARGTPILFIDDDASPARALVTAFTTAVGADTAVPAPPALRAVTLTRSVHPPSDDVRR
jgi:hypothetical protein